MNTSWESWFQSALYCYLCTFMGWVQTHQFGIIDKLRICTLLGETTQTLHAVLTPVAAIQGTSKGTCFGVHLWTPNLTLFWTPSWKPSGRPSWKPSCENLRAQTCCGLPHKNEANISIQFSLWFGYGYTDSGLEYRFPHRFPHRFSHRFSHTGFHEQAPTQVFTHRFSHRFANRFV